MASDLLNKTLTLYTGPNCHLCKEAKAILYPLLSEAGWELVEVNIQGSEDLKQRYGIRIPVVAGPDGWEKGWPFSHGQISRLVES